MATITAYIPLNMLELDINSWAYLVPTIATSSQFSGYYSTDPSYGAAFFGSGFSYNTNGPAGGTVNRFYETYGYGSIAYDVQGISVPVQTLVSWAEGAATLEAVTAILAGNDSFIGSVYNDVLGGFGGDDILNGRGGQDLLSGGDGIDTAVVPFGFMSANFSVTYPYGIPALTVSSGSNSAALIDIEQIRFSDVILDLGDGNVSVDDYFYTWTYRDVFEASVDPEDHYAITGWREGRDPNAFFSTNGYLSANADVDAANTNPLAHYHQFGWKEGRDPSINFDTALYLLKNPDVKAANIDPLEHYLAYGRAEGRSNYGAVGDYIQSGFDAEYYLLANPDVGAARVDAAFHFQTIGWKEGRDPNAYFDTSAYLATYTDVAVAGVNPLEHYNVFGCREGRDPSGAFDTSSYLTAYADVTKAGVNPLDHFLSFGIYEGRASFGDSVVG